VAHLEGVREPGHKGIALWLDASLGQRHMRIAHELLGHEKFGGEAVRLDFLLEGTRTRPIVAKVDSDLIHELVAFVEEVVP